MIAGAARSLSDGLDLFVFAPLIGIKHKCKTVCDTFFLVWLGGAVVPIFFTSDLSLTKTVQIYMHTIDRT